MSVLELYQHGIIGFLYKKGLLSSSTMAYVEYYKRYKQERTLGAGYREGIRRISKEFGVSETTIKKAVRLMREQEEPDNNTIGSMSLSAA